MKTSKKLTGFALASAAALMLTACGGESSPDGEEKAAAPATEEKTAPNAAPEATAKKEEAQVKCAGINSCKGTSACATATTGCHAQNACKGQGWIMKSQADCDAAGGKVAG